MANRHHQNDTKWRVSGVEKSLNYKFNNKKLIEEALTHPSCRNQNPKTVSYQRLELLGDAVLSILFSEYFYWNYPEIDEGQLSRLKQANATNEKLARVAIRHNLYPFLHTNTFFDHEVKEFELAVQREEEIETTVYGGAVKHPDVLADIVESLIGAVYLDCDSDLKVSWQVIVDFLEPFITLENLPLQPVDKLFQLCQKQGKRVYIKVWRENNMSKCSIHVDGEVFASGSSVRNKDTAKLNAARKALIKLNPSSMDRDIATLLTGYEMVIPKRKLHDLCAQMKWVTPNYSLVKEEGPAHDKKFAFSVVIETEIGQLKAKGDEKSRKKEAESSAAFSMLRKLAQFYLPSD